MPTNQLHSVMRVKQSGSIVLLQPFRGPDVAGDTLSVDLSRCACTGLPGDVLSRLLHTCSTPVHAASVVGFIHREWIAESHWKHCCSGSVELVRRGKIEFNYHTAFGVAALAPLASGYALVLILAGEKVRRIAHTRTPPHTNLRDLPAPIAAPDSDDHRS